MLFVHFRHEIVIDVMFIVELY